MKNIKKYTNTVDIFIDLHRDAYSLGSGKNYVSNSKGKNMHSLDLLLQREKIQRKTGFQRKQFLAENISTELNKLLPGISKGII